MGLLKGIVKVFSRGADEAADAARYADEGNGKWADNTKNDFVSDSGSPTRWADEYPGGTNDVSFADDSYRQRLAARATEKFAEGSTPKAVTGKVSGDIKKTTYALAGGTTAVSGIYVGGQAANRWGDVRQAESKEAAYEAMQESARQIRNNENMSPEEKQQALEGLRQTYQGIWGSEESQESPLAGIFRGLGAVETVIIGLIVVVAIRAAMNARGGA